MRTSNEYADLAENYAAYADRCLVFAVLALAAVIREAGAAEQGDTNGGR